MKLGISTACLYPAETGESLKTLLDMGYRHFEVFLNAFEEIERPFLRELKAMAEAYGATFCSVHPFTCALEGMLLFGEYPKRTREGFELYRKYAEAAAFLGGKYIVIHGRRKSGGLSDREYYERFGKLTRFLADSGVVPAHENVRDHRGASPEFLRGMREYLGEDCAFVLDVKQSFLSGCTVEETAAAMGDRLVHVHLSDRGAAGPCLLPGRGELDMAGLRRLLEGMGYGGAVVTEVYRTSFGDVSELKAAKAVVESAF